MFEDLAVYSRIAVTGPQRSGTTIAGKMIAADTGHKYVDEALFGVFDFDRWMDTLGRDRVVVQCPHMLKALVDLQLPGVFVVLMRRPLDEIHASEERIDWQERFKGNSKELGVFGLSEGDSAQVKYDYWDSHPKPPEYFELRYASLRAHPLWVGSDQRKHFGRKQTVVGARHPE